MTQRTHALWILAAFALMPLSTLIGGSEPQVAALMDLPPSEQPHYRDLINQQTILNMQAEALRLRSCLALELKLAECGPLTQDGKLTKFKVEPTRISP